MRKWLKRLLNYWEAKQHRRKLIQHLLDLPQLNIKFKKDSSIVLGCFAILSRGQSNRILTWKGQEILTEIKPKQIEKKLRQIKEEARKTNQKASDYMDGLAKRESNFKRFGFKVFKFSSRFIDHLKFGHIRIKVVDGSVPKRLADGSANPAFIRNEYDYLPGSGRPQSSFMSPLQPKVQTVGGLHILKNIDNNITRIVENVGTFKLPTGEVIRKVKIEFWVEETQRWMLKKGASTMWPKSWTIDKIQKTILEASNNVISYDGINKFKGKTKDGLFIEYFVDKRTKEIETGYIVFE
ncbi:EndoU domain-containing protein [uncultured Aquimarina sp.]|uniref:EndoU domain-containing protein n=1 Tax=uncultured Aquimarina sp. TaxID=575652 RepID=UPI00263727A7|nr:EndoU domain-containing protein [uncultured Aquimarina sp.]